MATNPKQQWQKVLATDKLREPLKSYQALQYLLQDPTLTYNNLCELVEVPYNTLTKWSRRYFYKERLQAYQEDMNRALFVATTNHNIKLIESVNKRVGKESVLLSNDLVILCKHQEKILQMLANGEDLPMDLLKKYLSLRGAYFRDNTKMVRIGKDLQDIGGVFVEFEEEETNEVPPGVATLVNALKENRARYGDKE